MTRPGAEDVDSKHNRIFAVVRRIPAGRVLTYGDVAALAGLPEHARLVGYALHALPAHTPVPWHRVINHRGAISTGRAWPGGELVQRGLLEAEGLEFDAHGRTSLKRYRWVPEQDAGADGAEPAASAHPCATRKPGRRRDSSA